MGTNGSVLPTTKPVEYYTDKSNIIQTLKLKLDAKTNVVLVILKHLDILDIFKYKISYYQLPPNISTWKLQQIFNTKPFYYLNPSNEKKLIKYDDSESETDLSNLFFNLSI
jgi:hypothetical protein